MNNIILSKSSAPEQVKTYFQKVLELKQTGKDFPINLDEVWPLVYTRKQEALRGLRRAFFENIDYQVLRQSAQNSKASEFIDNQVFRQKAENPERGRPTEEYWLSVSCLEHD